MFDWPAKAMDVAKAASTQSSDGDTAQPPSPKLMPFPSACSTPVSSSDILAVENLRKKASAGRGGERPGRYGVTHTKSVVASIAMMPGIFGSRDAALCSIHWS